MLWNYLKLHSITLWFTMLPINMFFSNMFLDDLMITNDSTEYYASLLNYAVHDNGNAG